jgi:hypothetical protein
MLVKGFSGAFIPEALEREYPNIMKKKPITRRKLLKNTALASVGGFLNLNFPGSKHVAKTSGLNIRSNYPGEKTRVVLIRDKDLLTDQSFNFLLN